MLKANTHLTEKQKSELDAAIGKIDTKKAVKDLDDAVKQANDAIDSL